ncbi:MAG TPA: hypothetical protein VJV58_21455, partial [Bradyrhizobium sp.]|uniref:hypothetical protein n=1 Tax=Bradyrhizobium sp. TaxID=376 RepID=UPI002B473819
MGRKNALFWTPGGGEGRTGNPRSSGAAVPDRHRVGGHMVTMERSTKAKARIDIRAFRKICGFLSNLRAYSSSSG